MNVFWNNSILLQTLPGPVVSLVVGGFRPKNLKSREEAFLKVLRFVV
ncbi:MAG: hypothetical protein M2R45_03128 [Verrucomicrobia subdivision 3 bacterium]|nr:hypothetical protein [Limisphaerales bacterium]MCS1413196.1 hypothetical protein [Limisphaerales bacterium]